MHTHSREAKKACPHPVYIQGGENPCGEFYPFFVVCLGYTFAARGGGLSPRDFSLGFFTLSNVKVVSVREQ